ncbi:MAG TPA: hypothetical protein VKM55_06825 [Candidatus Lokiarchaeia archaeon]|nr:hypothetical protein [Candidatus Lokiarchaeia archaeon]
MITKLMKNIDVAVNMAATLSLFMLISVIFIWHLDSQFIAFTLLPIISAVLVWKFMFAHFNTMMAHQGFEGADRAARAVNVTCVDYDE